MRGSWKSTIGTSNPSSRERKPPVVTAAIGAASAIMKSTRVGGADGSIGRYAAPVLSTARMATMASADRLNSNATEVPGAAPWSTSTCANRLEASSTSR